MVETLDYSNRVTKPQLRPPLFLVPLCRIASLTCIVAVTIDFLWPRLVEDVADIYIRTEWICGGFLLLVAPLVLYRYNLKPREQTVFSLGLTIGVVAIAFVLLKPRGIHN